MLFSKIEDRIQKINFADTEEIYMRKIGVIVGLVFIVIILGIFLINSQEKETEVTKEKTKVGFILNGNKKDGSWGESHYTGMEKSATSLNLDVTYCENVPESAECITIVEELIQNECKIIVCNSYGYGEWLMQMAEKYPNIYFFHASGVNERQNLATFFGRMYQIRYLSGVVAGMQTETDKIGYVAAFPISEVNRGINAFTLGVRSVNPDAEVYVEWSNSWTDAEKNEAATRKLFENSSIDVLALHTDSLRPLEVADEMGIWSIGYNLDNAEKFPNTYLTAAVWQWEKFYEPRILECLQGKFLGTHYWEGVETGIVSLAPLSKNVKSGVKETLESEKAKMQDGLFDVFYGPIRDTDGKLRVNEGECMADRVMLNEFDWYVEGVKINEE